MNIFWISVLLFSASNMPIQAQYAYFSQDSVRVLASGLDKPAALSVTKEFLYVAEQGANRVRQFDYSGNLVQSLGNRGSNDYQFNTPADLDATNGLKVYVSDMQNHRIQVFDRHWQLLSSVRQVTALSDSRRIEPVFLAVNSSGELFFYDRRSGKIVSVDDSGALLDEIPIPNEVREISGLHIAEGDLFVLDRKQGLVHRLSANGFYQSFYPAKDVVAFRMYGRELWTATKSTVLKDGNVILEVKNQFPVNQSVVDFAVTDKDIIILGEKDLIAISKTAGND